MKTNLMVVFTNGQAQAVGFAIMGQIRELKRTKRDPELLSRMITAYDALDVGKEVE